MIQKPKLYNSGGFIRILNPIRLSLTLNLTPLSTASIELPKGEGVPKRSWIELFGPSGSVGMYRVRSPHDAYGPKITSAELEHMISETGDYLVKEKIDEMLPAGAAMQRIFRHYGGKRWRLGSVSALGNGAVAVSVNYGRVLDSMLDILKQKPDCMMAFDFTTSPWTVSFKKLPTAVTAECRMSRNAETAEVSYDDSELCTRAFYQVGEEWRHKDAPTLKEYGTVEQTVSISSDMTDAEINRVVDTYLQEHQEPRVSVQIEAEELSRITGESMDAFSEGKLLRLAIPEHGVTVERHIRSLSWGDVYRAPDKVTVSLGDEPDTVVSFLHNLDSTGSGSRGGGGGRKKQQEEEEWKEYRTEFDKQDNYIKLTAKRVDRANNILEQAGLNLDSHGVLIYATDNKKSIGAQLQVHSNQISMVVKDGKLNVASIVTGINKEEGSYIKLKASTIDLRGYVTISQLNAVDGRIKNLINGNTLAGSIRANQLAASTSFSLKGHTHNNSVITIDGVNYNIVTWSN